MGLRVVTTCSPANYDLARQFGAEKVFDYNSPTAAASIRAYTGNTLAHAIDCVSQAETTALCYAALGRAGWRYVLLEPFRKAVAATRALTVAPSFCMGLTLFGKEVALDGVYGREARPADREMARGMFGQVQRMMDEGLFSTHPVRSMEGGWEGVMQGVDTIRTQTSSGFKMVYAV